MTYQPLPNPPKVIAGKSAKKATPFPNPTKGPKKMKPVKKNFAD